MPLTTAGRTELYYEQSGPADGPPVLMIMGLASQLTAWPPRLVRRLNEAGLRTVLFDNRDVGLSQKMTGQRAPHPLLQTLLRRIGIRGLAPYGLPDLADDADSLLTALDIPQAHVVGASMGGMIAQILTASRPERVISLTALMTSTNGRHLRGPRRDVARLLFRPRPARTREQIIDSAMQIWTRISTQHGGLSDRELRHLITAAVDRSHDPAGQKRQLAAIIETGDLRRWTRKIRQPTLVIHGDADPLVRVEGGRDVAVCIPKSRLEIIPGMGHDLPPVHVDRIADLIAEHVQAAHQRRSVGV